MLNAVPLALPAVEATDRAVVHEVPCIATCA